jgi:cell fate regulator YaaT (PSP1 superfamily)
MTENNNALKATDDQENPISQAVAGVRFRTCGKMYTFDVNDIDVAPGLRVVVDSEMGLSMGRVVTPRQIIEKRKEPLKKILRIATEEDFQTGKDNRSLEDEARRFCIEKVKGMNLPMKIVSTETTLDKKRLTFYFTAEGRIDFRELVRDLAAKFKTRIEMRQIGVRDEVKLLGGFGCCGRQTCCSLFLTSFEPITIRMAKKQELSINQSKLSGVCGRLMCCLGYEYRDALEEGKRPPEKSPAPAKKKSAAPSAEEMEEAEVSPGQDKVITEENESPVSPQQEKKPEQAPEEKKQFKRGHRRRRRRKPQKEASGKAPAQDQKKSAPDKPDQQESKNKGRPSTRRRKFWKKKKD